MKPIILLLALIFISTSAFMAFQQNNKWETSIDIPIKVIKENEELYSTSEMTNNSQAIQPATIHRYRVIITTTMGNAKTQLGEVVYRFNLALKPTNDHSGVYLGQAYGIQWGSNSFGGNRLKFLPFTVKFLDGSFEDVDLLGLDAAHPMTIINSIFTQFSYFLGHKTLQLADGKHRFHFVRKDAFTFEREWLGPVIEPKNYQVVKQQELWKLNHDTYGFPVTLAYTHTRTFDYQNQELTVIQQTNILPISDKTTINWSMNKYRTNTNQYLKELVTENTNKIGEVNEANFREQFKLYSDSPSLDNANNVGIYIVQQGINMVKNLIENGGLTDHQQSLLIFALERSQVPEGEYILSQLIEDDSLDEQNRLRAIMSISKMGEVNSAQALETLKTANNMGNQIISETALINIGILGSQSEALKTDVSIYLSEKLQSRESPYLTLISIDNLKDGSLDDQVSDYLQSENFDERMIAARVLSRNPEMQPLLNEQLLKDSNPNVVREILKVYLSEPGMQLFDSSYQDRLRKRIMEESLSTPTKEMLFEYLLAGSSNELEYRDVAENLYQEEGLSESTKEKLKRLLLQ
ncbi:HEAT repeat domain-containing protein [Vibrio caribbeanicus]|uniref:HEAT repeat domain-containing protein n=1 Tax=Vibrio caribbeanicus ATCC BAA-2122 TaxID=796620 RepID=E3BGW9_9VIBR|nr:HEAT repeat domain-containing protein [Vibrio caribbeanicus]EFP97688.1 hypothetical protein VIBC2010_06109 [Vibrio caribbeanicus ATCC BAA-2122]